MSIKAIQNRLPNAEEMAIAQLGSRELAAVLAVNGDSQNIQITTPEGEVKRIEVPVSALKMMIEILTVLSDGNTVSITPIHAQLTTQEAADILNMSRPTLIKILDQNEIPYTRTGNRRKVAFADVQKYKEELYNKRMEALNELAAIDFELGL